MGRLRSISREEGLSHILSNAVAHKQQYPTFNLEQFMEWCKTKPGSWISKNISTPTQTLNQRRQRQEKFNNYCRRLD